MKKSLAVLFLTLWIDPGSVYAQGSSAEQLPPGVRTRAAADIPLYEAAWSFFMDAVRTEQASGREAALARLERGAGLDANNAERFLLYAADATKDLHQFGIRTIEELVCRKRDSFSTGRELGEALEEHSRRYGDHKAALVDDLATLLDSESMTTFLERAMVRNSGMSGLGADAAEAFDGATADEIQAGLDRVCNYPRNYP